MYGGVKGSEGRGDEDDNDTGIDVVNTRWNRRGDESVGGNNTMR